jgi:hypothetical protein
MIGSDAGIRGFRSLSELRRKQALLVKCLGEFILYATSQGYELTLGEAYVLTPRKTRKGEVVEDGVHMPDSLHYSRLAIDLNLFVRNPDNRWEYVTDSSHRAWQELGMFWESLDSGTAWGGRFADANHLSVPMGGRA